MPSQSHDTTASCLQPGIITLLTAHRDWIAGRHIGLLSHDAAVDATGRTTAALLHTSRNSTLSALFGPEHGFGIRAAAGKAVDTTIHPRWKIPVFSLYGATRRPSMESLHAIDIMVYDIQDIGARPYTYASSLRYWLEAAAAAGKPVIVCDRPIPLPDTLDGPMLDPACASFVGGIPAPMVYGMTPGETARWLITTLGIGVDLRVAPMVNYRRANRRGRGWPPWVPPSPRMRTWSTAWHFTTTVFTEALPVADNGSGTEDVFKVIGLPEPWGRRLRKALDGCKIAGGLFAGRSFIPRSGLHAGNRLQGVRLHIEDPAGFRPVATAIVLIDAIQRAMGNNTMWRHPSTRADFFDKLFGTARVRRNLQAGLDVSTIVGEWDTGLRRFEKARRTHLLYQE